MVGNSGSLRAGRFGDAIDAHDIVLRTNQVQAGNTDTVSRPSLAVGAKGSDLQAYSMPAILVCRSLRAAEVEDTRAAWV